MNAKPKVENAVLVPVCFATLTFVFLSSPVFADWLRYGGPTGDFQVREKVSWQRSPPNKRWQGQLGPGMSGVVTSNGVGYTSYLKPFSETDSSKNESQREHREVVIAFDLDNGKTLWTHEYDAGCIENQQAFGGRSRAPQATPLVCANYLITLGFTGKLHCFDRGSGRVVWEQDLVERYHAVPVQFGFSASPVSDDGYLYLLSGGSDQGDDGKQAGRSGGLLCMNVRDGSVTWNVPCREASYATPVVWSRPDGKQVVFVTRNRVVGVAADDGRQLWQYRLPEAGLTNVPTPMIVDDETLIISGQGVQGTRRLSVTLTEENSFEVEQVWKSDAQFFYCNWIRHGDLLLGCQGKLLVGLDLDTGRTVGRFRGYSDSNLLKFGNQLLVLHGDGHISRLLLGENGLIVDSKYSVFNERCWTPPTLLDDRLYCRGGNELLCLDLAGGDRRAAVVEVDVRKKALEFKTPRDGANSIVETEVQDAAERIVATYKSDGATAAWELYSRIREEDPDTLSFRDRRSLHKLANEQGLADFANRLMQDAAEDFPEDAERFSAAMNPPKETQVAKNGLRYLSFSIRNTTDSTIQAEVRGPEKHPFGYGLPLRPGEPRLESWPVGTKLYRTLLGGRRDVLLTVTVDFAGRIIDVPFEK